MDIKEFYRRWEPIVEKVRSAFVRMYKHKVHEKFPWGVLVKCMITQGRGSTVIDVGSAEMKGLLGDKVGIHEKQGVISYHTTVTENFLEGISITFDVKDEYYDKLKVFSIIHGMWFSNEPLVVFKRKDERIVYIMVDGWKVYYAFEFTTMTKVKDVQGALDLLYEVLNINNLRKGITSSFICASKLVLYP